MLLANWVDNQRWGDNRFYQVKPGAHELRMSYRFEVVGGAGFRSEPRWLTCDLRLRYDQFTAGARYRFVARSQSWTAQGFLYDSDGQEVAQADVDNCGPF